LCSFSKFHLFLANQTFHSFLISIQCHYAIFQKCFFQSSRVLIPNPRHPPETQLSVCHLRKSSHLNLVSDQIHLCFLFLCFSFFVSREFLSPKASPSDKIAALSNCSTIFHCALSHRSKKRSSSRILPSETNRRSRASEVTTRRSHSDHSHFSFSHS